MTVTGKVRKVEMREISIAELGLRAAARQCETRRQSLRHQVDDHSFPELGR